jgi:hypothetical protein
MNRRIASLAGAGLFAGVVAWALLQQAGIVMASWACQSAARGIWLSGAAALIVLLLGALASALALRAAPDDASGHAPRPRHFLAIVALMGAALFLFAIALQVAAPLFLPGCIG